MHVLTSVAWPAAAPSSLRTSRLAGAATWEARTTRALLLQVMLLLRGAARRWPATALEKVIAACMALGCWLLDTCAAPPSC